MSEAADLRLLEDVQYRFALADTDEKLERMLNIYLVPTLLKLDTASQLVIRKVAAICSHLSKRVKASPVPLPTEALLSQFHNPTLGPYVKNFNLIYLDIALAREHNVDKYGSQLLQGISRISQSGLKGYFPIMMRALDRSKFDYDTPGLRDRLGLEDQDIQTLARLFEQLLLYDGTASSAPTPPVYVSKDGFPNLNALNAAKMAAVKLARGALGKEGSLTLFIGARDANAEISGFCTDALKRGEVDLEDTKYIQKLYELYFSRPRLNIQIAVVDAFSKSVVAANMMPQLLQIVEKGFQDDSHPKLLRAHIGFVQWVMRMASDTVVLPATQPLLTSLISALEQSDNPTEFRQFFYVCIGLIAQRNPAIIQQRIDILKFLFQAAAAEHSSVKVSVTECLSMVFPAVQNSPPEIQEELFLLVEEVVRTTPGVAVKFAFAFPFSSVAARGFCLRVLSQSGINTDVRQTAKYGLDPYYFRVTTQISRNALPAEFYFFPTFHDTVSGLVSLSDIDIVENLKFLRVVWLRGALGETLKFDDEDWRDRLDTAVEVDSATRNTIKTVLQNWVQNRHLGLDNYFKYLRTVLTNGSEEQVSLATSQLLELVTLGGKDISTALTTDLNVLKDLVFSRNEQLREKAAHLLGTISSTSPSIEPVALEPMAKGIWRLGEASVEKQHGAVLAVGSILARLALHGNMLTISKAFGDKFATDVTQIIVSPNTNTILLEAALQALSELCIFGAGTLFTQSQREQIIARLQTLSKTTRHGNLQDRAVLTLGYLSFSLSIPDDDASLTKILDALYIVHEQKQVELLFSAGQALSCVAARWNSNAMTPFRDADVDMHQEPLPHILDRVLNTVLEDVRSPKHPLRKAASIWLLSLLQFCDGLDTIKRNLERIHTAFVSLLTDRDDFVQETASKGMALVYLRGDKKMQDDLIWNLIGSITSEVRPSTTITGSVSAETQILGLNTSDAGEVSTYKEICNLASDTGNPELIYRFLALSSHSALWQSRKGAAIGMGGLLDQFSMQELLERNPNYAKRLVPKLYRLCRDPNSGVAKAMQDIWDAAFGKTSSPLVASMFSEIMTELLKGMGDKIWRTRQASAKAMGDLCSGVDIGKLEPYLEEIWKMAFRVADDIKESVRNTGMNLSQQLTTSLIRSVSEGKSGQGVISVMMPFLLGNSGLNSSAQGVQLFALRSIVKLCDEAGTLLKPMIPEIVDQLLDVLTTLEPQEVNYFSFHVSKKDTDTLDETRFHAVRSSPVMNAIEKCVDLADETNMTLLVPVISNKMKRAAGLPTKAGCAKLVVSMVMRKAHLFQPYADQALKAVMACLNDRNETVRKTYASTAGYLARIVSHPILVKYIESQTERYFSEDEQQRIMSGISIEAISRNASGAFTAIASSILPFVFFAKHDPAEAVREPFTETWSENTGGTGAIKLYIGEIMGLIAGHLEASQWRVKQVSALALADACEAIGIDIRDHVGLVMPLLLKGVGGRAWKGKEAVLKALVVVAENAKDNFSLNEIEEISKIMIREAKRKDLEYKRSATAELAKFVSAFAEVNLFEKIKDIVEEGLEELNDDDDDDMQLKPIRLLLRANLYSLASASFQPTIDSEKTNHAVWIIKLFNAEIPGATIWSTRIAITKAIQVFVSKCNATPDFTLPEDMIASLWETLKIAASDRGYESVRTAAASAVADYVEWVRGHQEWPNVEQKIRLEMPGLIAAETSSVIQAKYRK